MITIDINNSNIDKVGRWQSASNGLWSGWSGSYLRFKVSGTSYLKVNASIVCSVGKLCICEFGLDNDAANPKVAYFANNQAASGDRSVTFELPDTGEHTVILHTNGYNADIFSGKSKTTIKSIEIADGGSLSAYSPGVKTLQCVGDSWMAADNDWPRLMRPDLWKHYQIATGGLKASDMNAQYSYASSGVLASDPIADAVIVSYGVNDYVAGVSLGTFQSNLLALVSKIRAKQPTAPIFLIQPIRNYVNGRNYDKYGVPMQTIAGQSDNVFYISTESIWRLCTWQSDGAHLTESGKEVLADYISDELLILINIRLPFMRDRAGQKYYGETIITPKHSLRYKGTNGIIGFILDNITSTDNQALRISSGERRFKIKK